MSQRELFEELLVEISTHYSEFPQRELCAFWSMRGNDWNGELMVVGRATNGWKCPWLPNIPADLKERSEILDRSYEASLGNDGQCPMRWVTDEWGTHNGPYNTKQSAFWRVIKRAVSELHICDVADPAWPSTLVWSNLYKIAPESGGNPSAKLMNLQRNICKKILYQEIMDYQPRKLLFLTGRTWATDFLDSLGNTKKEWKGTGPVEYGATFMIGSESIRTDIVIGQHPQGKSEDIYLAQLLEAWKELEKGRDHPMS